MNSLRRSILIAAAASCLINGADLPSPRPKGPFVPEDWLRQDVFYPQNISPDGEIMVYAHAAPLGERVKKFGDTIGRTLNDLVLIGPAHLEGRPITDSLKSGTGYAFANWSPDGQHLAALALEGARSRIEVWDRRTEKWSAVTDWYTRPASQTFWSVREPMEWIDNTRILWAEQKAPFGPGDGKLSFQQQQLLHGWTEKAEGRVSASVLSSDNIMPGSPRKLNMSDLAGHTTELAEGEFLDAELSPDHAWLVVVERMALEPRDKRPLSALVAQRNMLKLVPVKGAGRVTEVPSSDFALIQSVKWSPDSSRFVFSCADGYGGAKPPSTYVYRLQESKVEKVLDGLPGGLKYDPQPPNYITPAGRTRVVWTRDNHLLMLFGAAPGKWQAFSAGGGWRDVAAGLDASPVAYLEPQGNGIVGLAGGRLWRLSASGEPVRLASGFDSRITAIVTEPARGFETGTAVLGNAIVVTASTGSESQYSVLDLATGDARAIPKPESSATLRAANPRTGAAFFLAADRLGAQSLFARRTYSEPARLLGTANLWRRSIDLPEMRMISYKALDGSTQQARLTLPPHYSTDQRWPMIVKVYPGSVYRSLPRDLSLEFDFPFDAIPLASHGYVVLEPSMPSDMKDYSKDVASELLNGVLPAIDKVIQDGIADGNRVGVIGHSFGGFAVFSLVTQTNRFKAAVSLSGISDFISFYGTTHAEWRYADGYDTYPQAYMETSQAKFGVPPWKDPEKYLRVSPLFHVENVTTPLLIVKGDWDFAALTQGEEFFAALLRLNKPVRFLRYWGEGHNILSTGNEIHLTHELYDWFDRYLAK